MCDSADLDERCGRALAGIRYVVQPVRLLARVMRESPELAGDETGAIAERKSRLLAWTSAHYA
jgi:hypothetical protein